MILIDDCDEWWMIEIDVEWFLWMVIDCDDGEWLWWMMEDGDELWWMKNNFKFENCLIWRFENDMKGK